jgi:DNA processing protein
MPVAHDHPGWIGLSLIPGLGGESYRRLLGAFGEPDNIYAAGYAALSGVVKPSVARHICDSSATTSSKPTLEWLDHPANHLVTLSDQDYPRLLLQTPDPPPLFYLKGRRELLGSSFFAIVGSRNASPQGALNAEAFARSLSDSGFCIVSGMAAGIDAAAHRGGLNGASSSIAVVGTGLDSVYPARNHALAHELAENGALISEFPLGTPAKTQNFPRRNRIISGLSSGCLVVEAALRSGSLITARLAAEQGREVFAVPGSIHSPLSKGCHALIKQGVKLVECAEDVLGELRWQTKPASSEATPDKPSDETYLPLLDALGFEPTDIDTLVIRSGLTCNVVCSMLLHMELDGCVATLPGGMYQRLC